MENYNFDKVLNKVGDLGRYQVQNLSVLLFSVLAIGMSGLAFIYIAAVPDYWCMDLRNDTIDGYNTTTTQSTYDRSTATIIVVDSCSDTHIPGYNDTDMDGEAACRNWQFDYSLYGKTVVTEWLLVCSHEWMAALLQTTYMCGILMGSFFGGLISDRFGRKTCWMVAVITMSVSSICATFMPNYLAFLAMRFLTAMSALGTFLPAIILSMETLSERYRVKIGMFYQLPFALGFMILAGAAYFIRNFRYLNLFIGLFTMLAVPGFWFVDESPRWLLVRGRFEEAKAIVRKMCERNNIEYPAELMEKEAEMLLQKQKTTEGNSEVSESTEKNVGLIDVLKSTRLRWRIIAISYGWVVCSLLYYGLSQASSGLPGGPYFNLFVSGLLEFPVIIGSSLILDKVGRKFVLTGDFVIAFFSTLIVPLVMNASPVTTTVLAMIGRMAISGAFGVIYVYTIELFPTIVRTTTLGVGSMCSRIGSISSPNIFLLSTYWLGFPYIIFGCASFVACFTTMILPETNKRPYQETIEDGETFGKGPLENLCELGCRKSIDNDDDDYIKDVPI